MRTDWFLMHFCLYMLWKSNPTTSNLFTSCHFVVSNLKDFYWSKMIEIPVLLKSEPWSNSQGFCSLLKVSFQFSMIFSFVDLPIIMKHRSTPWCHHHHEMVGGTIGYGITIPLVILGMIFARQLLDMLLSSLPDPLPSSNILLKLAYAVWFYDWKCT